MTVMEISIVVKFTYLYLWLIPISHCRPTAQVMKDRGYRQE